MKKILSLLLCLCLLPLTGFAEESEADTLLLSEITEWVARYQQRAMAATPINNPAEHETAEGYMFVYDFAILYADSPVMSQDTVVHEVVVTSATEEGPRGVKVEDDINTVLAAFYTENERLHGSRDFAVIYSMNLMPESYQWAEVQRDGQRVQTIQYAVHEQMTTGGAGYTDAGFIFTMEENMVSAIRAYGLDRRITISEVSAVVADIITVAADTSYVQMPFSFVGGDLAKFEPADLFFSQMDFLSLTPESATALLGEPHADAWMDDGENGHIRTMAFDACELVFEYDADKQNAQVYMMHILQDGLEGPRAVRIGDSFASVFNRFRNGEGDYEDGHELLYGSEGGSEFGVAEYAGTSMTLRYGMTLADGTQVVLHLAFEMMQLTEIMLYIAD